MSAALEELLRLPVSEKIEAINALWDSIDVQGEEFALTEEERTELDRRLEDADHNPGVGCTWGELKNRLQPNG
jgi:putative addiction module component (TIGR02574 family)